MLHAACLLVLHGHLIALPLIAHTTARRLGRGGHPGDAATVTRPVELEEPILTSGHSLAVQLGKNILRRLCIGEFNKTITKRCSLYFVADELDVGDWSNLVELLRDVVFAHPWLDVADPERASLRLGITTAAIASFAPFAALSSFMTILLLSLHWRVSTVVHLLALITTAHTATISTVRLLLLIAVVHVALAAVVTVTGTDVLVLLLLGLSHHRLAAHRCAGLLLRLHWVSVRVVHL